MADKAETDLEDTSSHQNIICPLCLDVFNDASMLVCGHTFCRKCLERYDAAHRDLDYMVCPLCRKTTKLDEKRVGGLPANVTVKDLVEEYHSIHGGITGVLEGVPRKCTACELQGDAVSFCYECGYYMCIKCDHGHSQMTSFFKGHQVVSMKEVLEGTAIIGHVPSKCSLHKHENKDLFCEDCKVYVCLKCMIVDHRDHKIKNKAVVEKELQNKVDDIVKRSNDRKTEFEKHFQDIEFKRQEIYTTIHKLQDNIKGACNQKLEKLKENERLLLAETHSLQESCDIQLDTLKNLGRQKIKAIMSSVSLVANERLRHLERESLAAHSLICSELEGFLEERIDEESLTDLLSCVAEMRFMEAGDTLLDLGHVSNPSMGLKKEVSLSYTVNGITSLSEDSILVGYGGQKYGADRVEINGSVKSCTTTDRPTCFYDVAHQSNSTLVMFPSSTQVYFYSSKDWSKLSEKSVLNENGSSQPYISVSSENEIIAANRCNRIHVYDPTASARKFSITTKEIPMQARATKSGLVVASSCDHTSPSKVRVYNRDGNAGDPIIARQGEYLYPEVDGKDRVIIASNNQSSCKVKITIYRLEGLNLKKVVEFKELKLTLSSTWCYLVSLSRNTFAFACSSKVYFLTIPFLP